MRNREDRKIVKDGEARISEKYRAEGDKLRW